MTLKIKVHKSYRIVVAVCDSNILGKKFEEGIRQLDVRESFFDGSEYEEEQAIKILQQNAREDATFNIIGEEATNISLKSGVITEECIGKVANIPFALKLI